MVSTAAAKSGKRARLLPVTPTHGKGHRPLRWSSLLLPSSSGWGLAGNRDVPLNAATSSTVSKKHALGVRVRGPARQ